MAVRQAVEQGVVLHVRRRDDDGRRPGVAEENSFKRDKPKRIEMLDDLDHCGRVEASESFVAIGERALPEVDALTLARWHLVQPQTPGCDLQRAPRDVDAD